MRAVPAALVALTVALAAATPAAAQRSEDLGPYEQFSFRFTEKAPDTMTGFRYRVALTLPPDGAQPPTVRQLALTFARGTRIDLGALPACTADDAALMAQGAGACPDSEILAGGEAAVYIGPGPLLELAAQVYPTGRKGVVVILEGADGNVVRLLRGTLKGRTLNVPIPALIVGEAQVALVRFALDIGGGTERKPVFRTPKRCTKAGWNVTYAPTFDPIGKVTLVDTTRCRR